MSPDRGDGVAAGHGAAGAAGGDGDRPSDTAGDRPGDIGEDGPGDIVGDGPGDIVGDGPGDIVGDRPGDNDRPRGVPEAAPGPRPRPGVPAAARSLQGTSHHSGEVPVGAFCRVPSCPPGWPCPLSALEEQNFLFQLQAPERPPRDAKEGLEVPLVAVVRWSTPKLPFTNSIVTHYRLPSIRLERPRFVMTATCPSPVVALQRFTVTYTLLNDLQDFLAVRLVWTPEATAGRSRGSVDSVVCHSPLTNLGYSRKGSARTFQVAFQALRAGLFEVSVTSVSPLCHLCHPSVTCVTPVSVIPSVIPFPVSPVSPFQALRAGLFEVSVTSVSPVSPLCHLSVTSCVTSCVIPVSVIPSVGPFPVSPV
uniref:Microtubule associated protein 11 n=1 Tax=Cyanoderma ruficeps TaxID=181631 RepID=A0A8C3QL10_9PASS